MILTTLQSIKMFQIEPIGQTLCDHLSEMTRMPLLLNDTCLRVHKYSNNPINVTALSSFVNYKKGNVI